ncbi:MAG: alanine/ornithine racemase family PLP-dependent enzyme [Desulfuromusa sp.]|nr:alanine/ornithine racemase family PLP-dependent enzyme [Desulfuromusa sp.]
MRKNPRLEINLRKLQQNVATVFNLCAAKGVEVVGVTKGFAALPEIAQVMVDGGIKILGDSRLENILTLRDAGIKAKMMLLRIPMLHEVDLVVKLADCSLNSELVVIKGLSTSAIKQKKIHNIILMVDLGDLREGVLPEDVFSLVKEIRHLTGVRLKGLGVNFNCISGVDPTPEKLLQLVSLATKIERNLGVKLEILSGGNTSSLALVINDTLPEQINQLRIGEGILLGHTDIFTEIKGAFQDSITLFAEIIELKQKESTPSGSISRDSFGQIPKIKAKGVRTRAILAIGKQDIYPDNLVPLDQDITIVAASSDHLVVDVTESKTSFKVGDEIQFILTYPGILSAITSKYVKVYTD